jgi:hypothetical protein
MSFTWEVTMNITIIGSFRKYYNEICLLIDDFEKAGIRVLSPMKSYIVKELNGFVLLQSDNKSIKPYQIQQRVFENAKNSDLIYVWNPDGYIGVSTAYEIGRIAEMNKTIYFKEKAKDLPIFIPDQNVKNPDQIIDLCLDNRILVTV